MLVRWPTAACSAVKQDVDDAALRGFDARQHAHSGPEVAVALLAVKQQRLQTQMLTFC